jgi:hypothetical protein
MKKVVIVGAVLFLMFLAVTASAQVDVGIIGGLNFSDIKGEGTSEREISGHTVFGVGVLFDLGLMNHLSLCMEPMVIEKSAIGEEIDVNNPAIDLKLLFVELPIFIKYSFGKIVKPYFIAGPTLGYLLSSEMSTEMGGITFNADTKSITEKLDVGIGFGGGVSFPVGLFSIFLEGRYTLGLRNINKGGDVVVKAGPIVIPAHIEETDRMKTRGLQVMAGIALSLGGQ